MALPKTKWIYSAPASATSRKADSPLFPYLVRLMRGEDLAEEEAADFFRALSGTDADPAQIAGCLVALTAKGETFAELAGMARAVREQAVPIKPRHRNFIDTSGTGLSPVKTFNISTAAAFVTAGAGLAVAKHSNRAVLSRTGSVDVLEKLGIKVSGSPQVAQTCLNGAGLCFMYAPKFYPHLRRMSDIRKSLGIRSCLHLLAVLANPTAAPMQLVGVWHPLLFESLGRALSLLGTEHAWLVHGTDGLDELTLTGETKVAELSGDKIKNFCVTPEDFGLRRGKIDHLRVSNAGESAEIIREVLSSKRRDEARSLIVLNAAAALIVGGIARKPMQAARLAEQAIDSGQAQNKLERLIETTNKR